MEEDKNKNRNNNKFINNEYIINNNSENEEYEEEYDSDNLNDYDYKQEIVNIIQKNILEYVEMKYLPLCEYLSLEKISKFIDKK